MRAVAVWLCLAIALLAVDVSAGPKKPVESGPIDEVTAQARDEFFKGTAAVKALQWNDALVHFERANNLKPSPVVVFNIGVCQRATGHYVLAIRSFKKAIEAQGDMPAAQVEEARAFVGELQKNLVHIKVALDPPNARLAIDGRPLVPLEEGDAKLLVAGVAPPGEGTTPKLAVFEVLADPGTRLVSASFPGHANVLKTMDLEPGAAVDLPLRLKELPSTIHVESDQARAVVILDGRDVGLAPVDITRPAGRYQLQVQKKGFATYETSLQLTPGQKANLTARMSAEKELITQKWWFWGGAAAIIAGGITATVLLTRPEAQPPDYQRGSLGWLAQPR